jgi:hypothetical protein
MNFCCTKFSRRFFYERNEFFLHKFSRDEFLRTKRIFPARNFLRRIFYERKEFFFCMKFSRRIFYEQKDFFFCMKIFFYEQKKSTERILFRGKIKIIL